MRGLRSEEKIDVQQHLEEETNCYHDGHGGMSQSIVMAKSANEHPGLFSSDCIWEVFQQLKLSLSLPADDLTSAFLDIVRNVCSH